jgi:hypothetical protein
MRRRGAIRALLHGRRLHVAEDDLRAADRLMDHIHGVRVLSGYRDCDSLFD